MKLDAEDRLKIRSALVTFIHPLKLERHSANILVNIYNVNKSLEIGIDPMNKFQESLPEGFRVKLSTKVVTMAAGRKTSQKKTNAVKPYNADLIMSRVLYLLGSNQLDFTTLFNCELAPVPTSLFEDSGEARYPTTKSVLMNKLKVEVSSRGIVPDAVVVDGGEMLHSAIYWPKDGLVSDLLKSVEKYTSKTNDFSDVCIIFDRYFKKSIKSDTRLQRVDGFKRVHHLGMNSPLPPKEICLSSIKTKKKLFEIIVENLLEKFTTKQIQHKLTVTSDDIYPEETSQGIRTKREDLESHFDEADYIIPQQVDFGIRHGHTTIKVISDVFVLLCYHYLQSDWSRAEVYLEDFQAGKGIISIKETVEKNKSIVSSLTALHAISGCDSVPRMFGIGKPKALSVTRKKPLIGKLEASKADVIQEAKSFCSKIYGMKNRFVNFSQTSSNQNRKGRKVMRKKAERRGRGRSILDMI